MKDSLWEEQNKYMEPKIDIEIIRRLLEAANVPQDEIEEIMDREYKKHESIRYRAKQLITNSHAHKF